MNWNEYCPLALRTEAVPSIHYAGMAEHPEYQDLRKRATRLMHAAAGLVTETQELADADSPKNVAEELGDCFWYLPIIADCFPGYALVDHEMVDEYFRSGALKAMQHHAAELLNYTLKRHVIYGKELEVAKVTHHAEHYAAALIAVCKQAGVKPGDCMEANIKKLEKRYPKLRFDVEDTSNRDVEHELSHIQAPPMASVMPAPHDMSKLSDSQKIATVEAMMSDAGYYLSPYAQKELGIKREMAMLDMRKIVMDLIPDNIVLDAYALHVEENAAGDICIKLRTEAMESISVYDEVFNTLSCGQEHFSFIMRNEFTETEACAIISSMALALAMRYRDLGANSLAEGFKTTYVKIMESATIERNLADGYSLYCMLYPEGHTEGNLAPALKKFKQGSDWSIEDAAE